MVLVSTEAGKGQEAYVVSTASGSQGQIPGLLQCCIESIALLLCTCVLPVRAERVTESTLPLTLGTAFQLLEQCLAAI